MSGNMDAIAMSLEEIIKTKKKAGLGRKPKVGASPASKKGAVGKKAAKVIGKKVGAVTLKTKRLGKIVAAPKAVFDARNKIIQKNRSKITDARDKLAQITKESGDVRLKLLRKKMQSRKAAPLISASAASRAHAAPHLAHGGGSILKKRTLPYPSDYRVGPPREFASSRRNRLSHDVDIDMDADIDFVPASIALRRTVQNDIAHSNMPPLPSFSRSTAAMAEHRPRSPPTFASHHHHQRVIRNSPQPSSAAGWAADPFDCYEVPIGRPADVSEPKNLQRQFRNVSADAMMPTKGILRYSRDHRNASPPPPPIISSHHRSNASAASSSEHRYMGGRSSSSMHYDDIDDTHLSYEMRNRLQRAPDSNASMGIFSNPYTLVNKPMPSSAHGSSTLNGYRIVVSNLHSSVSQSDIRELFEDIGELVEARLVRPGVSEVIYRTMKDAELAVETYHNRQLDGQPMKCLLVNPRASSKPTAPAIKSSSGRSSNTPSTKPGKTPLEIDIDALHKVLFQPKMYARSSKH